LNEDQCELVSLWLAFSQIYLLLLSHEYSYRIQGRSRDVPQNTFDEKVLREQSKQTVESS
jgi:hypothetical protein